MKTMKRFGCLLLVLAMVLALGISGFAASGNSGSITISGALTGETYTIYQIFDLTYTDDLEVDENTGNTVSGTASSYSYKLCDGWANFLSTEVSDPDYRGSDHYLWSSYIKVTNGYVDPESEIFSVDVDGNNLNDGLIAVLAKDALAYAKDNSAVSGIAVTVSPDGNSATVDSEESVSAWTSILVVGDSSTTVDLHIGSDSTTGDDSLPLGYWLVDTSLGSLCMLTSTDPDAVINEKNGEPTLDKWVMDVTYKDADTETKMDEAEVIDTLEYHIAIYDAANVENLILHDFMDEELVLDEESVALYLWDGEYYTVIDDSYYSVDIPGENDGEDNDPCDFEVVFDGACLTTIDDSDVIYVVYRCSINADEDAFEDDIEEFDNEAYLTYGNAQQSETVETETYTYGFEVYKYSDYEENEHVFYFDRVYYDFNEGYDEYVIYYEDNDQYYYAIISDIAGTCNADGWYDGAFTITGWTNDSDEATRIVEPTNIGDPTVVSDYFIWFFIYVGNDLPEGIYDGSIEVHLAEIETDSVGGDIEGLNEVDAGEFDWTLGAPLAGAEFQLSCEVTVTNEGVAEDVTYYAMFTENSYGEYVLSGWTTYVERASTLVSGVDGMIYIEGLTDGETYILTETKAPDGYNLLGESYEIEIVLGTTDGGATIYDQFTVTIDGGATDGNVVNVLNNHGTILPGTGGIGTTIFYVIGAILVCGAVVLLVTKRRTSNKDQVEA